MGALSLPIFISLDEFKNSSYWDKLFCRLIVLSLKQIRQLIFSIDDCGLINFYNHVAFIILF
jgi:hypothetical protein